MKPQIHQAIDNLYKSGINICKGCQFEHTASCGEDRANFCQERIKKHNNETRR